MSETLDPKILKSQRKKPSQGRSQTLVLSIIEAAARLLPKAGYDGVTTNQLAKVAGVSVGSIYQYFSNKDEIFVQVLEKNLVETKALIENTMANKSDTSLKDLIAEAIGAVVDLNLDNREFFARLFIQAPRLNRVVRIMESRDQFVSLLVNILRSRQTEVKTANLELASYAAVHAVMGVIQTIVIHPPANLNRQDLKAELTNLVTSYLCI